MSRATVAAVEVCPRCGGPRTSWGCRPVPLGDFCWQYGLIEDLSRRPPAPVVDPLSAAIEQDREVRKAADGLAAAMDAQEAATATWERAALEGWRARARSAAESNDVFVDGQLVRLRPADLGERELRRLQEAEAEADEVRRRARARVVAARQLLEEARTRARRRLSR